MTKEFIYIPQNATTEDKFKIIFESLNKIQNDLINEIATKEDIVIIENNYVKKNEIENLKNEIENLKINFNDLEKYALNHEEKLKMVPKKITTYKFFWINVILLILFNMLGTDTMSKIINVISNLFNVLGKLF